MKLLRLFEITTAKIRLFSVDGKRVVFSTQVKKLTNFPGDSKHLAHKAYPVESQDIRDHLVLREGCISEGNKSQSS